MYIITIKVCQVFLHFVLLIIWEARINHFLQIIEETRTRYCWWHNIKRQGPLPFKKYFDVCADHFKESCFKKDLKEDLKQSSRGFFKIVVSEKQNS